MTYFHFNHMHSTVHWEQAGGPNDWQLSSWPQLCSAKIVLISKFHLEKATALLIPIFMMFPLVLTSFFTCINDKCVRTAVQLYAHQFFYGCRLGFERLTHWARLLTSTGLYHPAGQIWVTDSRAHSTQQKQPIFLTALPRWISDWFKKADKNKDGRMNFKEVQDLLKMMNVDMNEHHANRLFTVQHSFLNAGQPHLCFRVSTHLCVHLSSPLLDGR